MPQPTPRTCSIEGCDRPHHGLGLCRTHYRRLLRTGDPLVVRSPGKWLPTKVCSVDRCDRVAQCRGWCSLHYDRWRRHGDPTVYLLGIPGTPCAVDGCGRIDVVAWGWCAFHYGRWKRNGDPEAVVTVPQKGQSELVGRKVQRYPDDATCLKCDRRPVARWLCGKHYSRWYRRQRDGTIDEDDRSESCGQSQSADTSGEYSS